MDVHTRIHGNKAFLFYVAVMPFSPAPAPIRFRPMPRLWNSCCWREIKIQAVEPHQLRVRLRAGIRGQNPAERPRVCLNEGLLGVHNLGEWRRLL